MVFGMDTIGKEDEALLVNRIKDQERSCISCMEKRMIRFIPQQVPPHRTMIPG